MRARTGMASRVRHSLFLASVTLAFAALACSDGADTDHRGIAGSGGSGTAGTQASGGAAGSAGSSGASGASGSSSGAGGALGKAGSGATTAGQGGNLAGAGGGAGAAGSNAGMSSGGATGGMSAAGGTSAGGANASGAAGTPAAGGSAAAGAGAGGMAAAGSGAGGTGGSGGKAGYQPCPTNGEPCRILPFGDSITDGVGVTGGGSYRIELFSKALEAGKDITFTGGQMNGPQMVDGVPFPRRHEGHSGWRIAQLQPLIPEPAFDPLPHIVLLHIGTNDIAQNDNLAQAPARLGALIDDIVETAPEALVVVAKIIPLDFGGGSAISTYNDAIPGIVEARASAGKHVVMVDQNMGFPNNELADGVHPNAQGYARMASVWWTAIADLIP